MIENGIHFLLVPDANARRLVLANLVERRGSTIGVMVGTWLELISQVSSDYCLSLEQDSWQQDLQTVMQAMSDAFFAQSFEVDPDESFRIIESTLISLITSVEINADISTINLDGIESARTRKIVADLIQLFEQVNRLPSELSVMRQVCTQSHKPLRCIQVYHHDAYPWLSLWQSSFIEALNADSGNAADTAYQEILEASVDSISCTAQSTLGHLQQNLFHKANKVALDESMQWLRVRDYLQEVETTAGMIQSMCDRDESLSYADFALVVPHADEYIHAVKTVFEQAAIPVSGLPKVTYYRDHGVEAVLNYLICQQKPAPVMAMAAFLISPLMPWAKETGIELSDELMGGKYDIELAPGVAPAERQALSLIQENNETVPALNKSLLLFKKIITAHANTPKFHVDRAVDSIDSVLAVLSHESNINWAKLKQLVQPEQLREELAGETMQEGVAVSLDSREPWAKCKHLIVLGFNKRRYPTQAGTSAIFSEDDVANLALCGSTLVSRKKQNELHRDRFIRQVRCARESCTFFLSHLNADASSNHPSESLVYMHNLLDGPAEAEDLILNLDSETDRRLARDLKIRTGKQKSFSWSPCLDDVNFNTDLLALSEDNQLRRLSPSRLGDLMVSPLAWFLSWIGIELKEWSPEEPGPIILGSLAHGVYENLFKPGKPIPAAAAIKATVPDLLEQELKRIAPFMLAQKWAIERHKLADDITRSAVDWGHALERLGATIVDNEIWLKGEYSGIPIHGQADCILKLPNAQLAVVDYKKAGIANREKPMSKGYDCQVSLYREMLSNGLPEPHQSLDVHHVEVLYYMMNSQKIVAENFLPGSEDIPGWVTIENDVSVNAMALIKQRVDQIRRGEIILNNASDERFYDREAGLKPYALDRSPLVRLFMKPDEEDSP
jgi:hypothetical protein